MGFGKISRQKVHAKFARNLRRQILGNTFCGPILRIGIGPKKVSECMVANTELSEFFGPHGVPGRELSEFFSAFYVGAKANSPSFSQNSLSLLP